jgi:hypothetical protein
MNKAMYIQRNISRRGFQLTQEDKSIEEPNISKNIRPKFQSMLSLIPISTMKVSGSLRNRNGIEFLLMRECKSIEGLSISKMLQPQFGEA